MSGIVSGKVHTLTFLSLFVCVFVFLKKQVIFPAIRSNFSTDGSVWILFTTCSKRKMGQFLELPNQIFRKFWNSGTGLGRYEWNIFRGCLFILDLHNLLTHDHPHIRLYVSGPTTEVRFVSCHWNSTLTMFILYLFLVSPSFWDPVLTLCSGWRQGFKSAFILTKDSG